MDREKLTNRVIIDDILVSMEQLARSNLIKNDEKDLYRTNLLIAFEHISILSKNMVDRKNVKRLH
jgi:hypothetical protein